MIRPKRIRPVQVDGSNRSETDAAVPDRPVQRLTYRPDWVLAMILGVLALLLTLLFAVYMHRQSSRSEDDRVFQVDPVDAEEIVGRGSRLIGLAEPAAAWTSQLAAGRTNLAQYLLRLFVSPQYLSGQPDDRRFIADLHRVLSDANLAETDLDGEMDVLNGSGSRLAYINDVLSESGLNGRLPVVAKPANLLTLSVDPGRLQDGGEVIGRLPVDVRAHLSGPAAVLRLYAGGQICDEQRAASGPVSAEQAYQLTWNTDVSGSGDHQLALLVLSSDGRGQWTDLGRVTVPEVFDLPAGTVQHCDGAAWYRAEPWTDGTIRLNIVQADRLIRAELYDAYSQLLAETVSRPGQPGALLSRAETEVQENQTRYVRIRAADAAHNSQTDPLRCTLVSAPAAALDPADPDNWLAVLSQAGEVIQTRDASGQLLSLPAGQAELFDPQARLSSLTVLLPDRANAGFAPVFHRDTYLYALYVQPEVAGISLEVTAAEGSAALVRIQLDQQEREPQVIDPADPMLSLAPDINTVTFSVTGFDGDQRSYVLHILRPPDREGFSTVLGQFPFDWRTPLFLLHVQYPAYRFEAHDTGIDWPFFLDAQDERDRSLIDAAHVPVDWVETDSPVYDGSSWKAAARQVIAHYADPRNFLNPVDLFQFEKLTFVPELHTLEGIELILQDTFMEKGRSDVAYASLILEAGVDADISPFFIAARIIQEMGRQGQSPLSTGALPGYEGIYNFYNIGATPNPDVPDGAQINGARFALYGRNPDQGEITPDEAAWLLPWTTPQRAIIGGARWIAERYVAIGQDTLYGQKFDLVAEDGLFIHQYAQNIQMAWAEGRRTRKAWLDLGLIQESFTFRIPIYAQMPETPASLP